MAGAKVEKFARSKGQDSRLKSRYLIIMFACLTSERGAEAVEKFRFPGESIGKRLRLFVPATLGHQYFNSLGAEKPQRW